MRRTNIALTAAAVFLSASLLLARVHPFGDPGLFAPHASRAPFMENSSLRPEVRAILAQKCADCHSLQTHSPAYGRFAPISWLLERDVVEGRRHMNLSLWETYTIDQRQTLQAEIVEQTKTRKMPLPQYLLIHRGARITRADLQALTLWTSETPLEVATGNQSLEAGDGIRGKADFEKRCTGCHSLNENGEGPRLAGVYGRTSGAVTGYPYSAPLKQAHIIWDGKSLEQWLADPDTLVPGNDMVFHVAKPEERRDIIAFLKQATMK